MRATILFPNDVLSPGEVDDSFHEEWKAVLACGALDVALIDLDSLLTDGMVRLKRKPMDPTFPLVYRGWMVKPEQYRVLYNGLANLGLSAITAPGQYEALHLFPETYDRLARDIEGSDLAPMPGLLAYEGASADAAEANGRFSAFMMKDWVKSVKGTGFPARIGTPVTQDGLDGLVADFVRRRGDLFTRGIVLKEYVDLACRGGHTNEWRAFFLGGSLLTLAPNSCQGAGCPAPPKEGVSACSRLGSPFYTVDFAELEDGRWTVIETGDGQVSGIAEGQGAMTYYRLLAEGLAGMVGSRLHE
jgi:hypothetical protein